MPSSAPSEARYIIPRSSSALVRAISAVTTTSPVSPKITLPTGREGARVRGHRGSGTGPLTVRSGTSGVGRMQEGALAAGAGSTTDEDGEGGASTGYSLGALAAGLLRGEGAAVGEGSARCDGAHPITSANARTAGQRDGTTVERGTKGAQTKRSKIAHRVVGNIR